MAQPTPQEVEAQAYAFRQLVQHLQNTADDAQNIDVMSVAGMCRNCVAKWLHRGLAYAGDRDPSYDRALEVVYGEPYPDWKKKHQKGVARTIIKVRGEQALPRQAPARRERETASVRAAGRGRRAVLL